MEGYYINKKKEVTQKLCINRENGKYILYGKNIAPYRVHERQ